MRFNINNSVRVKLTEYGRECLRKNHNQLFEGSTVRPEYSPPKEDADGWSEWQLWCLMSEIGPHISLGFNPPFETEIEILETVTT